MIFQLPLFSLELYFILSKRGSSFSCESYVTTIPNYLPSVKQILVFHNFMTLHNIYFLPKIPPFFLYLVTKLLLSFIIQLSDLLFCEFFWLIQTDSFWLILSIFNWNSALTSIHILTFSLPIILFICLSYWFVNSIKARTHVTFWNQTYQLIASPLMATQIHINGILYSLCSKIQIAPGETLYF